MRTPVPDWQTTTLLGAVILLLAAVAAGAWGLTVDRGEDDHHPPVGREWAAVPGGWLQVRDVTTRSMDHKRVPGMATMPDPDPVPPGQVRIRIGVVLAAEGEDLAWREDDFRLTGHGTAPLSPHDADLGDGVVPAGSQVAGGVFFDAPEGVTDLRLVFRGGTALAVAADLSEHAQNDPPDASSPAPKQDDHTNRDGGDPHDDRHAH